eukprot:4065461-Alexandrium_andersonii.AAC.1
MRNAGRFSPANWANLILRVASLATVFPAPKTTGEEGTKQTSFLPGKLAQIHGGRRKVNGTRSIKSSTMARSSADMCIKSGAPA